MENSFGLMFAAMATAAISQDVDCLPLPGDSEGTIVRASADQCVADNDSCGIVGARSTACWINFAARPASGVPDAMAKAAEAGAHGKPVDPVGSETMDRVGYSKSAASPSLLP
jgi:hypothetical protein